MTSISELRAFAARRHSHQEYDAGVPYWVHLLIAELVARRFFPGDEQLLEAIWGHDLVEDTGTTTQELAAAGFSAGAILDIDAVTDVPAANRKQRKALTLPRIAERGRSAIKVKLCDRAANVLYGLHTGNHKKLRMYAREQAALEAALFDSSDVELLPLWQFLRRMLADAQRRAAA
jgi:(p)ppGpp synthase/HD superfamily hydrolase